MNKLTANLAFKAAYAYLDSNPDKNIPKLLDWVERFDIKKAVKPQTTVFRDIINKPDSNWYSLIKSVWSDIDPSVRKVFFQNFFINATIVGGETQRKVREQNKCNSPWAILMDPTSACNLHCTGCWAADYGDKLSMSLDTLEEIIRQGKELGVFFYIYSGGEPLVRKKDIITLCERHPDCMFLSFTNATLIDEEFADEMLRVKNFVPAISVEGFGDATDQRRGEGTYAAVMRAMEILKRKKLIFGVSCCYTSQNADVIGSEEYFDDLIAKGAKFAWFFTYMPVGNDAVPDLIARPEQREFMYHQIRKFRETKPLFTMDFWNDGEYVDGCIAGGRRYLHINANGDIEPCAFIHYAETNIHKDTLLDALKSPLFMQYHDNQPFNDNQLRPCPMMDNPYKLAEMVEASGAKSTDMKSPENVRDLCDKTAEPAERWKVTADRLWAESHGSCKGCAENCSQ